MGAQSRTPYRIRPNSNKTHASGGKGFPFASFKGQVLSRSIRHPILDEKVRAIARVALALLLTIALGIGSNVSVHGFVRGIDSTRLSAHLYRQGGFDIRARGASRKAGPLSYQKYLSLKSRSEVFEWIGAVRVSPGTIALAGQSAVVPVAAVTTHIAGLLDTSLDKGAVISHRMWQSEFGAKAGVRGDQIRIDGVNARVSDVAPAWLEGLYRDRAVDVWISLQEEALERADRGSRNLWVLGRLRRDVSTARAQMASAGIAVLPYSGMTPEMAGGISRIGTLLGSRQARYSSSLAPMSPRSCLGVPSPVRMRPRFAPRARRQPQPTRPRAALG